MKNVYENGEKILNNIVEHGNDGWYDSIDEALTEEVYDFDNAGELLAALLDHHRDSESCMEYSMRLQSLLKDMIVEYLEDIA